MEETLNVPGAERRRAKGADKWCIQVGIGKKPSGEVSVGTLERGNSCRLPTTGYISTNKRIRKKKTVQLNEVKHLGAKSVGLHLR